MPSNLTTGVMYQTCISTAKTRGTLRLLADGSRLGLSWQDRERTYSCFTLLLWKGLAVGELI